MAFIKRGLAVAAAVIGIGLPAYGNLLINGSFELGSFVADPSHPGDDTMSLAVGATDMTGWTVENAALAWIGSSNPFVLTASDGGYFLDLTGITTMPLMPVCNRPFRLRSAPSISFPSILAPTQLTIQPQ